jgi:hypothetical protein
MNPIKFTIVGGYVTSKNDGDRHYVSARKLASLYGLDPREHTLIDPDRTTAHGYANRDTPDNRILTVRFNGDYEEHLMQRLGSIVDASLERIAQAIDFNKRFGDSSQLIDQVQKLSAVDYSDLETRYFAAYPGVVAYLKKKGENQ